VGAGAGVLNMHRPALGLPTVELAAIADVDAGRGRPLSAELGCTFYADHREMLAATRPDVAVIMTPHPFHAAIATDCLEAGCHVLTEKPMALHVGEADAMIETARRCGRLLAVNFQYRHRPEVRRARELIQAGRLGAIQRVELTATWTRTAAYYRAAAWRGTWLGEGGGVLMNQAIHNLDVLCHLLGMPKRLVAWTRTRLHEIETEDTAHAMLEWPGGGLGFFHATTAEGGEPERLELVGTGGRLQLGPGRLEVEAFDPDLREHVAHGPIPYSAPAAAVIPIELEPEEGNHTAVYRDLHAAILDGTSPMADGAEGRMSLELANAMIYSSHTGEQVELPLDRDRYAALLDELRGGARRRDRRS
jgi:predicted dehydrogenase